MAVTLKIQRIKEIFLCLTAMLLFAAPAFAQGRAGEVLQQLERKELVPKEAPEAPVIEKKEEMPKEAIDGKKILIRQIKLTGVTLIKEQTLKTILSKYEGKELTLSEMNQIAENITAKYRKQGYIIAYAYIPPQEIKDGILEIRVMEGKIGEITIIGNKSYSAKFIQKRLERIKKDPSLKEETLERALLILNEYPSLSVRALLTAGKDFGTTDITAQVKDSMPISGSISYDNFGTNITSKHRAGITFNIGNLITSGDYLMLRGLTGLDRIDLNKLSYGRAEYLFPIDYNGTKIGMSYSNSAYEAGEQYAILDIHGKSHVVGMYITHPVIKTRERTLDIRFGFDYKDVYDYLLDSIRSEDNIRVFNLGMTYDFFDRFLGRNIISFTYHQGVRDLFGGSGKNDPNTSRLNADGAFTKYTADIIRLQKLPGYNHLYLRASGQFSEDNLFVAEQFILFADHGGVYINNIQPGESKNDYLTSIGAGIRLYAGKHFSVMYDYAAPKIKDNFNSQNAEHYLQAVFSF